MIKLHAQEEDIKKKKKKKPRAKKSLGPLTFFTHFFFRPFQLPLAKLSAPVSKDDCKMG